MPRLCMPSVMCHAQGTADLHSTGRAASRLPASWAWCVPSTRQSLAGGTEVCRLALTRAVTKTVMSDVLRFVLFQ